MLLLVQYWDNHACKGIVLVQSWCGITQIVPFPKEHCHVVPWRGFHSTVRPLVLLEILLREVSDYFLDIVTYVDGDLSWN